MRTCSHFTITRFVLNGCKTNMKGSRFSNRLLKVNHLMLHKMMSFVEMSMSVMFQYTVLLQYNEVQYVVVIKTSRYFSTLIKGELQREIKLISYERAFKMLENFMYIAGIGQAVLELLSLKVGSGNHQRGIFLLQKFSEIFRIMRIVSLKMTSHLTSHNFQILKIEIFSKPRKI